MKTFADLKRRMVVGTAITLVSTNMPQHRYLGTTRRVTAVQSNAIMFEGGSWLYWGKASTCHITGPDTFTIDVPAHDGTGKSNGYTLNYRIETSVDPHEKPQGVE